LKSASAWAAPRLKSRQRSPEHDYLGIEVHTPGVGALLKQIGERNLTNLRIIQHDAVEVLQQMIADASLAGIHIYFPDPWHKSRHHKRRLIQPAFVATAGEKLKPGGYLHLATDWENYAEQMLEVLSAEPA
jgi:tRNA (guanine-N7-)-methyltransferase